MFYENLLKTIAMTRSECAIKCRNKANYRSSSPEVFLRKGILKICSKFTEEHSCRSVISIKLLFIDITLWHGYSPVNLLHIFRTPFYKNTSGQLLLKLQHKLNYSWLYWLFCAIIEKWSEYWLRKEIFIFVKNIIPTKN